MSKNVNYYVNANKKRVKFFEVGKISEALNERYIDADRCLPINRPLYEDYLELVLKRSNFKRDWDIKHKKTNYKLFFSNFLFTTDYIGPSRKWSLKNPKISKYTNDEKMIYQNEMLLKSRVLGGHIIWPTYNLKYTTNQARGGDGFFDRIDITLKLLQLYMENKNYDQPISDDKIDAIIHSEFKDVSVTSKVRRVFKSFDNYKEFYDEISTFENFCEMNMLIDSFVVRDGERLSVVNLQPESPFLPVTRPSIEYTDNNINCIELRQKQINECYKV